MTKKTAPIEVGQNPLEGYCTAIETLMAIAKGDTRSRIRLEAAQTLLEHCSEPPLVDWGVELLGEDAE